jgi:iron(II)-dependent oxidoreductase
MSGRASELSAQVSDARSRTLELMADLTDEQLLGPRLAIVNPMLWEAAHVAWFQELWVLRTAWKQPPLHESADRLYDSSAVPHDVRWDLPLFPRGQVGAYLREVRDRILERLARAEPLPNEAYYVDLSIAHEDMHDEAFSYTRQTLELPPPPVSRAHASPAAGPGGGPCPGDVEVPGGTFLLGAPYGPGFIHDNEKWAHERRVEPFAIARAPVTQAEFAGFVEDRGYLRRELWSDEGWTWREREQSLHPVYWRRDGAGWLRRHFDRWVPLEPHLPALHVCWHEAEAYCRWRGRRLPTELEWEVAAAGEPTADGRLSGHARRYPWGDDPPAPERANLDWRSLGCVEVGALPAGDSAFGCRQMVGNVWEWTADDFLPYPGFSADPYVDYSQPWFGTHKVLRGGCWVTRARLIRNTWRNFYPAHRRDVWAGFRTCALR